MEVEYYTIISFSGSPEEKAAILEVLRQYDISRKSKRAYFEFGLEDSQNPDINKTKKITVSGFGPYGHYMELNDVDIFRDMSSAAPGAEFVAEINGSGTYDKQKLQATLIKGKLYIKTWYVSNEGLREEWKEYVIEKLPYEKFLTVFGISKTDFSADEFEEYVETYACDYDGFADVPYEEFVEVVNGFTQSKAAYKRIIKTAVKPLNILSSGEYEETKYVPYRDQFVYDPITKQYIKGNPFPSGVVDVTNILKDQLESRGESSDDETISQLSVEEAYDLLEDAMRKR